MSSDRERIEELTKALQKRRLNWKFEYEQNEADGLWQCRMQNQCFPLNEEKEQYWKRADGCFGLQGTAPTKYLAKVDLAERVKAHWAKRRIVRLGDALFSLMLQESLHGYEMSVEDLHAAMEDVVRSTENDCLKVVYDRSRARWTLKLQQNY